MLPRSDAGPELPELVIFDVDGTLQDSIRWWPRLACEGVAAFGAEHGLELPLPDHELAYSVIGKPDSGVWASLLPEEHRERWPELRDFLVPMEVEILSAGVDYCFPGTRELLGWLRGEGVRLALASNCRSAYFAAMLEGQGLGPLVDAAYCLDSPGVSVKDDMVGQALERFGTRDALMVGDRDSDQQAAWAHGLPFVHRTGFHAAGELRADAVIESSAQLRELLMDAAGFWAERREALE